MDIHSKSDGLIKFVITKLIVQTIQWHIQCPLVISCYMSTHDWQQVKVVISVHSLEHIVQYMYMTLYVVSSVYYYITYIIMYTILLDVNII